MAEKTEKSTAYELARYVEALPIPASQVTKNKGRARRKPVEKTTYKNLIERMERLALEGVMKPQTVANRVSALRAFVKHLHVSLDDPVGQELRTTFNQSATAFAAALVAAGKSNRNAQNTISALRPWREIVVAFDTERAVTGEDLRPFNRAFTSLVKGISIAGLAKTLAVPPDMMRGWLSGKKPRLSSLRYITRVENYFGVPSGELAVLAGLSKLGYVPATVGEAPRIEYRERLRGERSNYLLVPDEDSPLRTQWRDLLAYKTSFAPELRRATTAFWRITKVPLLQARPNNWYMFGEGGEVPSARFAWYRIAAYLGWLCLPKSEGGAGIPREQAQTLAWFAVKEKVEGYLRWRVAQAGDAFNGYAFESTTLAKSLVNPETGFIGQQPQLQKTLPDEYQSEDWTTMCMGVLRLVKGFAQQYAGAKEETRNPRDPIAAVLSLPNPMDALADMVLRIRANRPTGPSPFKEARWARDLAMVKFIISNPLRLRNLCTLTWREDNTGQLYQRPDGSWWVKVPKYAFKNARGAAGDSTYDMPVQEMVWQDLERYLKVFRPKLLNGPSDYVFVGGCRQTARARPSALPWVELSGRIEKLTRQYLWRCPGVGVHAFRHLVATSIIKASGHSDFKTAALVLNDRLSTVEKHYAHLRSGDGALRMGQLLGGPFDRMR